MSNSSAALPINRGLRVTVVIPCLNESKHIEKVVIGFLNGSYPPEEVIVVDGGSSDGTQAIVQALSSIDRRIRLLSNPQRIQSAALNIALAEMQGDVYLRADAHCLYNYDYVEKCIDALYTTRALNVGGAQRFVAENVFQCAVAVAIRSPLGSGGAKYRDHQYSGYADTVFLGCFRRETLLEIGGYDPNAVTNEDFAVNVKLAVSAFSTLNVTNQDAELNRRLTRSSARAVYVSADIKVYYFPRSSMTRLILQYFKYGRGRLLTSLRHRQVALRGTVPALGVIATLCILVACVFERQWAFVLLYLLLVASLIVLAAVTAIAKTPIQKEVWQGDGEAPSPLRLLPYVSAVLAIMPLSHGCGLLYQLGRVAVRRRLIW